MNRSAEKHSDLPADVGSTRPKWWRLVVIIVACLLVALGCWFAFESSTFRLLDRAADAAERKDFSEAERLAKLVLASEPDSVRALFLAGSAAAETRGAEAADAYFKQIPDDGSREATHALFARAEWAFQRGWATDAETLFKRVVDLDPQNVAARERLLFVHASQGRMWEATGQVLPLLRSGRVDLNYLVVSGSSTKLMDAELPFVQRCLQARPDDALPRLIEAKWAIHDKQLDKALPILTTIVRQHPRVFAAQAALGRTLLEIGTRHEFLTWHEQLPEGADEYPDIWFIRGRWCDQSSQHVSAVRCFAEALRRDPNHAAANSQLATALETIGRTQQAEVFATRARQLARLALSIDDLIKHHNVRDAVVLLRELGRLWEAAGWCQLAMRDGEDWAKPMLDGLLFELKDDVPLTKHSSNYALQYDFTEFPLPSFATIPTPIVQDSLVAAQKGQVTFRDVAAEVGLVFTYENGSVGNRLESLFELDGGGVGAIDYDLDGWPDLYLTQGGALPRIQQVRSSRDQDCLFRNLDGQRFVDVSIASGVDNGIYSQGLAVGDYDADGFPDLYVANIGTNTLYHNNGDGTFREVSADSGTQGTQWTSSCVMADLSGDGLPDLYVVNYIGGDELYTQECRIDREPRCAPVSHAAEQDRLYLNRGDGSFADITDRCGVIAPEGRGLGVVAADFDDSGRLSLFVSNDMSANFFFENTSSSSANEPTFKERAILNGVAYDSQGVSQASMGIAVDDANQDGLLDLFVTNFYREANAFYTQSVGGVFRDEISAAELQQATFPKLGWGTQFVDAELDGIPDLVVSNGHVHDPFDKDVPYRMQPQFFQGQGGGKFKSLPPSQLGPYFQGKHLGRAVARLDWDRNGLEDLCVGHLDTPVALLQNQTSVAGGWLSLTLIGVESNRDAIGTSVQFRCGDWIRTRQLTAGDGFQCRNERRLVFGLGQQDKVDEIQVRWPSGHQQTFNQAQSGQELIVIEGYDGFYLRR